MTADSLAVAGHRLEVAWFGKGRSSAPTLVLLHEGLGSVSMWRDFPERLAVCTGLRVFAYSRRGYGASDGARRPRPLDYMEREACLLPVVLAAAGLDETVLFGHSDGASIALLHAASGSTPGVRAVIAEAPHVFVEDRSVASIADARDAYLHGDLRARLARHHDDVDGAFWGWCDAWLDPGFRAWNIEPQLTQAHAPLLAFQSADDPYGTSAQLERLARSWGGQVECTIIGDRGHAPHRSHEDDTLRRVQGFLDRGWLGAG